MGLAEPAEANPYVMAVSADAETLGTFADQLTGRFFKGGVPEGNYSVELLPAEGFLSKLIENVSVMNGQVTDLGSIVLEQD